jgi:hypothetical protein
MNDIDFSLSVDELSECVDGRRRPLRGKLRATVGSGFVIFVFVRQRRNHKDIAVLSV